jgi:hypothetical protein
MWPWQAEIGNEHWAGETNECHLASEWFSAPGRAANRELPLSCVGMFSRQMEIVSGEQMTAQSSWPRQHVSPAWSAWRTSAIHPCPVLMLRERASMKVRLFEGSLMGGRDALPLPEAASHPKCSSFSSCYGESDCSAVTSPADREGNALQPS